MAKKKTGRDLLRELEMNQLPEWKVPKIWPDSSVVVIGGGPSVKNTDLSLLHPYRVIAVNNSYQLGNWDVLFFGDERWYYWHKQGIWDFPGMVVTCNPHNQKFKGVLYVKRDESKFGISEDNSKLRWNLNSGAAAINLAVLFGAKRIILVGFDMKHGKCGNSHWHGWHTQIQSRNPLDNKPYARHMESFPKIKEDADRLGIEIINTCMDSAIEIFPKVELEKIT